MFNRRSEQKTLVLLGKRRETSAPSQAEQCGMGSCHPTSQSLARSVDALEKSGGAKLREKRADVHLDLATFDVGELLSKSPHDPCFISRSVQGLPDHCSNGVEGEELTPVRIDENGLPVDDFIGDIR